MTRSLVLLHGFTGSPDSWKPVLRLLEDDAAAARRGPVAHGKSFGPPSFVPALLGHDGTAGPAGIDTFEAEVDRLGAAVWDRARAVRKFSTPAHLVGYSLGARVGLGLLVRHPELFASATLIGVNPGLGDPEERDERVKQDEAWARLLETEGLDSFVAAWEALPLFSTQEHLAARVLRRQRRIRLGHDPAGLARSLRVLGLGAMPDYGPALDGLELPVRLVVGGRDEKFQALAGPMAERLSRARVTTVPDVGHNVVLEDPNATAALLREEIE
jgi:2-succinyl-6-hydroxy-2,4-cyclohexadiene-1-carboxylate synthase